MTMSLLTFSGLGEGPPDVLLHFSSSISCCYDCMNIKVLILTHPGFIKFNLGAYNEK